MRLIGLAIAFVVILGVAILASKMFEEEPQPAVIAEPQPIQPQPVQTVDIIVAKQDIPIGAQLTANMLDRQPWPKNLVLDNFVTNEAAASILGTISRATFQSREPIIKAKLSNPNNPNFMAAQLGKGMRAMTLKIDEITGVAGFVFPGDRVDVLIRHRPKEAKDFSGRSRRQANEVERIVEVLVPNLRVLAVNQEVGAGQGGAIRAPRSVSVEVSKEDAQRLHMGAQTGIITLTLRSIEDRGSIDIASPTREREVSRLYNSGLYEEEEEDFSSNIEDSENVRIIRGVSTTEGDALPRLTTQ
jgi:pilus assembly protein CpaB